MQLNIRTQQSGGLPMSNLPHFHRDRMDLRLLTGATSGLGF